MRAIRKIVAYQDAHDGLLYPDAKTAKEACAKAGHREAFAKARANGARLRRKREGPTQVMEILTAVAKGAKTAGDVSKRTGVERTRAHSLLTYLRRRGLVKGFTGGLTVTVAGKKKIDAEAA